jgi:SH3-like domain-containing protein
MARDISLNVFDQSWSQGHLDGNPDNGALVITIPIQDLSVPSVPPFGFKYALNVNGINVRSGPGSNNVLVRTIWRAQTPFVFIIQVSGEWGKLFDDTGWVFMAYLNDVL